MQETRNSRGDDVGDETVIDLRQSVAPPDTSPDGAAVASRPTAGTDAFETTSVMPRGAAPIEEPSGGSSSDPPTRFLRGIDEHIELPPGSLVDDLEVEQKLGEGAMGVVYKARHTKLGRQVAVKVISPSMGADPQALARFEREARALATLRHPNIVDVYSFGELPDGRSYFTMEYLDGVTLYERLQRGRVPVDEALTVLGQMAAALEVAHAAGIVHRDLKPENTFLHRVANEPRAVVKIVDWGLARLAVPDGVERTASGAVIGTSLYLSPEQARGPNVDGRTDIYALGVVAYELILSQHPFPHAQTSTAAIAAHLTEDPPQPRTIWPGIPAALDTLLHSMLAKDPSDRPTLAQVRDVIASVRSPTPIADHTSRAVTEPTLPKTSSRAWIAAVATLALGVGIALGVGLRGGTSGVVRPRMEPVDTDSSNANKTAAAVVHDAGVADDVDAVPATTSDASHAPTPPSIDAGRRTEQSTPPPPRSIEQPPLDAATDTGIDAAPTETAPAVDPATSVEIPGDAGVKPPTARQPQPPPTKVKKPEVDRDRTFDPFTRRPR